MISPSCHSQASQAPAAKPAAAAPAAPTAVPVPKAEDKPKDAKPKKEKEAKKEAKLASKSGGSSGRKDGIPSFYSALPKEKLFSLSDSTGTRRWVPLGRAINGWKLESYDPATQILVITQGAARHELSLNKSLISASATEVNTTVTLNPGQTVRVGGMGGMEVSVSADLSR